MVASLIQLTKEFHEQLAREGKIRQVSEPLLVESYNKFPDREMYGSIGRISNSYRDANAYMIGDSRFFEVVYVTPLVFYEISTEKQSGELSFDSGRD